MGVALPNGVVANPAPTGCKLPACNPALYDTKPTQSTKPLSYAPDSLLNNETASNRQFFRASPAGQRLDL